MSYTRKREGGEGARVLWHPPQMGRVSSPTGELDQHPKATAVADLLSRCPESQTGKVGLRAY